MRYPREISVHFFVYSAIFSVTLWCKNSKILHNMKYVELNISVADSMQAEILTALLSDYPFEAFAEEEGSLKAYIQ